MSYERVSLEYQGRVAVLKFNHPEVLNAVGAQMLDDLAEAIREIRHKGTEVRSVLLTGEGRAFCAGANLTDGARTNRAETLRSGDGLRGSYHPIFFNLRDLDAAIVTAVNGPAAGVGMSFALAGDMVCAAKSAYFLQAFARVGLVPDGGSTWLLPRLIGRARALEMSMLADKLPAEQALEWGLINRVFEDDALLGGAMELAERLANGPKSIGLMRRLYWDSWNNTYEQQMDLEARTQNDAGASRDAAEGTAAFREKRAAQFTGT